MSELGRIGRKIRDAIDAHRAEADRLRELAWDIELAWKEWNVDYLVSVGVITQAQARKLADLLVQEP